VTVELQPQIAMPPQVTRPRRVRRPVRSGVILALMILVAVVMLYPFWFMIDTSLQSQTAFLGNGAHSLASWRSLDSTLPWAQELKNSAIVCALSISIILVCSTMAGFAFAKLRYPGATVVFLAIIAALLIPVQSIIIPAYVDIANWNFGVSHLLTSYTGAVLMYAALGTPFATFLMTAYYRGLPDEVIEAGVIDGLSYPQIFVRIALPMSLPALATIFVLQFIQIWDDLLVGLLFLQNPSERTITVGLGALAAGRTTDIPVLMAGSLISALPAIIVFLVFQRFLVNGLTAGIGK
jgi:multiple sugar transport system permease protein/raffinose/stachyose/melibiose transport system permease protein